MGLMDLFKSRKLNNDENDLSGIEEELNVIENNTFIGSDDFFMEIEDVFPIIGKGIVATGKINTGSVTVGEKVKINNVIECTVMGIEQFGKKLNVAKQNDNIGLILKGIDKNEISRGDVLSK